MNRIARVFPRRTAATPTDDLAFTTAPPLLAMPEIDEVHVSVAFTYDMERAEELAKQWEAVGVPVKMGGSAFNAPGGEFEPGMYLKPGYTITSRGCPNHCWFCSVPQREGSLRELPIKDGFNVIDDNLLACSDAHVHAVFDMLARQKERPLLTGGLEARLLKPWHVEELRRIAIYRMYFAYDTPDDYEPLVAAGCTLRDGGIPFSCTYCYVLIGYQGDTFSKAEKRLLDAIRAGFRPMAMLYKDEAGHEDKAWRRFQGQWARPAIIHARLEQGEIAL